MPSGKPEAFASNGLVKMIPLHGADAHYAFDVFDPAHAVDAKGIIQRKEGIREFAPHSY